jgi:hypothetical protein
MANSEQLKESYETERSYIFATHVVRQGGGALASYQE